MYIVAISYYYTDKGTSLLELKKSIIKKANDLARRAKLEYVIIEFVQCNSAFYCDLYKALSGSNIIFQEYFSEEIKCQLVLEALEDFLSPYVKLEHIKHSSLAFRSVLEVKNLLDIFAVLFKTCVPDQVTGECLFVQVLTYSSSWQRYILSWQPENFFQPMTSSD